MPTNPNAPAAESRTGRTPNETIAGSVTRRAGAGGMNRHDATVVARQCFPGHVEAAVALVMAATAPRPSEARDRAARALLVLDPDEAFYTGAVHEFARGIATVVVGMIYTAKYKDRTRLAGLLDAVLREADQLRSRERAA